MEKHKWKKKKRKIGKNIHKDVPYEENDLRKILKIANQKKVHVYELLKKKGYIKDPLKEFMKAE